MRRILLVLTVMAVMAAMLAVMAAPAFARDTCGSGTCHGSNPQTLGKESIDSNCSTGGDFFTYNRGNGSVDHFGNTDIPGNGPKGC
jgi:hypothetical protein